jgi:hypothetical protein
LPAGAVGDPKLLQATVTIRSRATMVSVPDSFLGISTEYWAIPLFERQMSLFKRVISLIHVRGDGPFVLRIGGDSADVTFWAPRARRTPRWRFNLTRSWLTRTSDLVRSASVRLILDLNLVTGSPSRAAEWARVAESALPTGSIAAFEIGNEPDIYSHAYWQASISRTRLHTSFLPKYLSKRIYADDFRYYAAALAQVAPSVPLVGPALANPAIHLNWISSLLAAEQPELGVVSAHRYPFSGCVPRSAATYATIARILSERASAGVAEKLRPAIALAHRAGRPFRLTELNSVTCGGRRGVSNTFATALWAPDALFELMQAGVDGVNLHVRPHKINAAFTLGSHGLGARPLLYGMILFTRTLAPNAQLVPVQLRAPGAAQLKAYAVRLPGGVLHVLLIHKGTRAASVYLRLPARGPATVERLLAPAVTSQSRVTLDGQQLGRDGRWHGHRVIQTIRPDVHGYRVTVPAHSAALVKVRIRAGALQLGAAQHRAG